MSRFLPALAVLALLLLYFMGLTSFGLTGPDEPRYASIGREMATSGDWVTPRLWGQPWFEKPALLYWMIGGARKLGAGDDLAPRLPGAICGLGFLVFFFFRLSEEFGQFAAAAATGTLGLSALWLGFSHAATPDILMATTYAAAMLVALPLINGRRASLSTVAVLLGLSVLAKGVVPLVLSLPLLFFIRRDWREWLNARVLLAFLIVAAPWYVFCTIQNGPEFLRVFFLEHQLGRFTSDALQHVQPFWFYVPVLLGAMFPATLLGVLAFQRALYSDRRLRMVAATVVFGFIFFSASRNKLPGYLLPLLPLLCILIGAGVERARRENPRLLAVLLAASALLLPLFALTAGLLPQALSDGLTGLYPVNPSVAARAAVAIPLGLVAACSALFLKPKRAMVLLAGLFCAGWLYVVVSIAPAIERFASARSVWKELPEPRHSFCIGDLNRSMRYGLSYYAVQPLAACEPGETSHAILRALHRPSVSP